MPTEDNSHTRRIARVRQIASFKGIGKVARAIDSETQLVIKQGGILNVTKTPTGFRTTCAVSSTPCEWNNYDLICILTSNRPNFLNNIISFEIVYNITNKLNTIGAVNISATLLDDNNKNPLPSTLFALYDDPPDSIVDVLSSFDVETTSVNNGVAATIEYLTTYYWGLKFNY